MDKSLIITAAGLLLILLFFFIFEKSRFSSKDISIIIVLAAIAALGRIPFAAIPSAQPTTFIVILTGLVFGYRPGILVGVTAALVSNMFLGHGPWTIFQAVAWGLCGFSSGLFANYYKNPNKVALIIFAILWGYLFGWITNFWHWYSFVYPLTFKSWILVNAASFWFDSVHAIVNGLFIGIFGTEFMKILKRFKKKLNYTYSVDID